MEGAGYHRVARRLKGRAARWSRAGGDHLGRRLAVEANGELAKALAVGRLQPAGTPFRPVLPRRQREAGDTDPTWLQPHLPARGRPAGRSAVDSAGASGIGGARRQYMTTGAI
ncbi:MAG: hypothetical protein K6U87_06645 [Firmicutes bacterium]|nr:hypothetical protein [Bacillota bacterium]